ncbi:MAG TPA: type II toxin-antitoxin system HicA family toxin [Bryobacteraceae bacterium]
MIRAIENDGWYFIRARGSHRQYKHPAKRGRGHRAGPCRGRRPS